MSERVTIVLPNGTKNKLKIEAELQSRKIGNLLMRYVLEGILRDAVIKNK